MSSTHQRIAVFQERGSGEQKIRGIREHGRHLTIVEIFDVDQQLPTVIDDPAAYLPSSLGADLVLDYLRHPDLRLDLALLGKRCSVPVVSSGRSARVEGLFSPPT